MKVSPPAVTPRLEELHNLPASRVNSRKIWALEAVAGKTSPGKILQNRWAAVLLRQNVFRLERELIALLRHLTVFATIPSALPDLLAKNASDFGHARFRCSRDKRALAFSRLKRLPTRM